MNDADLRAHRAGHVFLAAAVLLGGSYMIAKAFFDDNAPIDFAFLWWAGELWTAGASPYGPAWHTMDESVYGGAGNVRSQWFFYPPHWWPVSSLLAQMPLEQAVAVWRGLSVAAVLGSMALLLRAVRATLGPVSPWRLGALVLFACASSAVAITLALGQTSAVLLLGISLFCSAWLLGSRWQMVLALVLLSLKPNFGLAFLALAAASGGWWASIAWAAGIALLAALPALVPHGFVAELKAYLEVVGNYSELATNAPQGSTGLRNLVATTFGTDLSPTGLALAASVAAALVGGRVARGAPGAEQSAALLCLIVPLTMLFASLHEYDALFLVPLIPLCLRLPVPAQGLIALALLVVFRANNLATLTGLVDPRSGSAPGSLLLSLAYLWLVCVAAVVLLRESRRRWATS